MRAFLALLRREYLEHRGAFLYAPLILIGLFTLIIFMAFVSGHYRFSGSAGNAFSRIFDLGYFAIAVLWTGYGFIAVFFYFADAFNADRRNNAMLFWKSMPQSDFKILLSKMTAGLTTLPALLFIAMLVTGIIAGVATLIAPYFLPVLGPPDPTRTATTWAEFSVVVLVYEVLALLWFAPFFAWVGGLSTVVGRWSIPLALLIPVIVSLFEGVVDFGSAPGGSYVLSFLRQRTTFTAGSQDLQVVLFANAPIDMPQVIQHLLAAMDWPSTLGGLVFSFVVIALASLYRRRSLKG